MSTDNASVLGIGVLGSMVLGTAVGGLRLITDRTAEDVRLGNEKGVYGAADLNRVGEAVLHVADRLKAAGNEIGVSPKIDWIRWDIPTSVQMLHYLEQLRKVRDVLAVYRTTPTVPNDMAGLTRTGANDIEKILLDVDELITNMTAAYCYSGDLYGGEM